MSTARPRKISQIKPLFGNLAQTSHYQVSFGSLPIPLQKHLNLRGVDWRFVAENAGLLCSSASLPGSSIGTSDIIGDVSGVAEKMANSRIFTALDLTFYVDKEYKMIKFLEHWIEFITSGSGASQEEEGYFFRMKYPKDYKTDTVKVLKFDRDYRNEIEYNFFKLFPTAMYSPTVAYNDSQVLTVTASFNYERYVCGSVRSIDISYFKDNNKQPQNVNISRSNAWIPVKHGSGIGYKKIEDANNPNAAIYYDSEFTRIVPGTGTPVLFSNNISSNSSNSFRVL